MEKLFTLTRVISTEEALQSEIILNQALIDILIAKNIISEDELLSRINRIKEGKRVPTNDWESLL